MLNVHTAQIAYYIIELGGFLGTGEKFFAIPFRVLTADANKQQFIFDEMRERLENTSGFDKAHWSEMNIHYYNAEQQALCNNRFT